MCGVLIKTACANYFDLVDDSIRDGGGHTGVEKRIIEINFRDIVVSRLERTDGG